jgi:phage tail sheath protein FI
MPSYVTPGLYYETIDTARNDIDPTRVDIPAFIGITSQGPLNQATQINSQAQFQANFGGFIATSYLAYTVRAFFENGGTRCYVVRVASKTARAASVVLQDETGKDTICISANGPGVWGNDLTVALARTNSFATQTITDAQHPATLGQVFVDSMVGFTPGTLVKVFQPHVPSPLTAYIVVTSPPSGQNISRGSSVLYWNDERTPLKDFDLSKTLWLETVEFSVSVYLLGQLREVFTRLSFGFDNVEDKGNNKTNPYYIENTISEANSLLICVHDLQKDAQTPTPLPQRFPAMKNGPASMKLSGARDGLADMQVEDFTGDPTAVEKRGLRALEDVLDIAIVAIPDLTLQPAPQPLPAAQPPPSVQKNCLPAAKPLPTVGASIPTVQPIEQFSGFSPDDVARAQQAIIDFCESQKRCMALLDPPAVAGKVLSVAEILNWSQQFDSKYAALYYPQLLVYDPLKLGGQIVRAIPPSGHVAGMFARVDTETGVHQAPANEELNWVQGVNVDVTNAMQGMLNPADINCIRQFPGRGIRIYGARTLSSDPSWRYVNVRRLFIMLERSLESAMQWTVFEPNNFALHQTLVATISTFLNGLWKKGAFAGSKPSDGFFVKIDDQNNPPELANQGQLLVEVGVAPAIPAEFVIFRIGLALDQLEVTE